MVDLKFDIKGRANRPYSQQKSMGNRDNILEKKRNNITDHVLENKRNVIFKSN